jgi:8-oxo-dGTP diphosphatase
MKHYTVVAAIIINGEHILCLQRKESKYSYVSHKYEFPGGKIENGESKEQALLREIKEELELDILIEKEFITVNHVYPDFSLTMHSFICTSEKNDFSLKEHVAFEWLKKDELSMLDWAAADIPIVDQLMHLK